jgi:hypothetical protein
MRWIRKEELGENAYGCRLTENFSVENPLKVDHCDLQYYESTLID